MDKNKSISIPIISVVVFSIIVISISAFMSIKNAADLNIILENSIKSELISISVAARSLLDVDKFYTYTSMEAIENDKDAYDQTLYELRSLKRQLGATYIYALKYINGQYYFIFDTDEEEDTIFEDYEISEVHRRAFRGEENAGIMNVVDEFGSFNTGAVPIIRNDRIIGIISTDIEDKYILESRTTSNRNSLVLVLSLFITMSVLSVIVMLQQRNVGKMQDKLFRMANYDVLTGLPNRQFLMTYLPEIAERAIKKQSPFAFVLIDLDNFKSVNDNAGHDAGDDLLRHIATYLNNIHEGSKSFRPPAGALNVSARIGGDEFVQIIPNISTEAEAHVAAKKMLDNFTNQHLDRFIEKYKVGLSIGIALFPYHTDNFNALIKYADIAMYHAKNSGKNTYRIYDDEMNKETVDPDEQSEKTPAERRRHRR